MTHSYKSHLEFYKEHQISPVRYDLMDLDMHLERRKLLYIKLGLNPFSFRNARVLEVAAGSGHNSLYLSQTMPTCLILLEPNPTGIKHIVEVYSTFHKPHTKPEIIPKTLEDFDSLFNFDIVICENWLGTTEHEKKLLIKLAKMVEMNGLLVLTTVSPVGFVPNLLRRLLANYLISQDDDFEKSTEILVNTFESHLKTLSGMTRNYTDWVQDNMLNPAYFGLCLSIPNIVENLGHQFQMIGSSPAFVDDWRWFKDLYGSQFNFNKQFLLSYWKKSHNFLDYRSEVFERNPEDNIKLEKSALSLLNLISSHENAIGQEKVRLHRDIIKALNEFISLVPQQFTNAIEGFNEVLNLLKSPHLINIQEVSNLNKFSTLFGRETGYISLMRMIHD